MTRSAWVLLLALAVFPANAQPRTKGAYIFTVNGQPYKPEILSLRGDPDTTDEGDALRYGGLLFPLGSQRDYTLEHGRNDRSRIFTRQGGKRVLVGAYVTWTYKKDKQVLDNPLEGLSKAKLQGLRAVHLEAWSPAIAKALQNLDPERVCLSLGSMGGPGGNLDLPDLPGKLRCLRLDVMGGLRNIKSLSNLKKLRHLRLLEARFPPDPFDAGLLANAGELRYLKVLGSAVAHPERLARLKKLRSLSLSWSDKLTSVAFVSGLSQLRLLDLERSKVTDLTPLAGLTRLKEVNANLTPVSSLPPGKMPSLRRLSLLSARLGRRQVAAFAARNPSCEVVWSWTALIRKKLSVATRVRVRSGGTCHRRVSAERTIFELRTPRAIRRVLKMIAIDGRRSGSHCMCCGTPTMEFYREDERIGMVGMHHGEGLRWREGWPGDGKLTAASARKLKRLLRRHGWPPKGP